MGSGTAAPGGAPRSHARYKSVGWATIYIFFKFWSSIALKLKTVK